MKKFLVLAALLLSACNSVTPYYEQNNFQPTSWAKKSFEEAKAACRYQTLNHNKLMDTYELETPRYKACMEQEGYKFTAKTNLMGDVQSNKAAMQAVQPSALQPRVETSVTAN